MVFIVLFINFFYLCISSTKADFSSCVAPPMECPNVNITFWLYTRENEGEPHQLLIEDPESIDYAPWVLHAPVKIIIHGYTGDKDFSPNTEIRPAYLECCNYNIISVDYSPIAKEPCYFEAARNTELVGMCTAELIDELIQKYAFDLAQFHVIGFSLGGQTAGFVGNYVESGTLERLTALDPAMPLFVTTDKDKKIDSSDGKFVDVLHTNAMEKGKLEASGHVDFYANGGMTQPGCKATKHQTKSGCSHARAPAYYAESIRTEVGFYATKCYTWITYIIGWCEMFNSAEEVLFGEYVSKNVNGSYFFTTNSESPYARGPSHKSKRKRSPNKHQNKRL